MKVVRYISIILSIIASLFFSSNAFACEEYQSLSPTELKEYRNKLVEKDADPFDRLFAFEGLVCSDKPAIRAFAIKEGLKSSSDELVRHQILIEAMMQKTRIDILLSASSKSTSDDKTFIKEHSGVYSRIVKFRSRQNGCLGLFNDRGCFSGRSMIITGGRVELTNGNLIGVFDLSPENKLIGFIRASEHPKYSRIPAVIELF